MKEEKQLDMFQEKITYSHHMLQKNSNDLIFSLINYIFIPQSFFCYLNNTFNLTRWSTQCVDLVPALARERCRGLHPRIWRGAALFCNTGGGVFLVVDSKRQSHMQCSIRKLAQIWCTRSSSQHRLELLLLLFSRRR